MSEDLELFDELRRNPFANDPNSVPQENPISAGNIQPAAWAPPGRGGALSSYQRSLHPAKAWEYYPEYSCPTGYEAEIIITSNIALSYAILDSALFTPYSTRSIISAAGSNYFTANNTSLTLRGQHMYATTPYGLIDWGLGLIMSGSTVYISDTYRTQIAKTDGTLMAAPTGGNPRAFGPDGKTIFGFSSNTVQAWTFDPRSDPGGVIATSSTASANIQYMCVSPDGTLVAAASYSGGGGGTSYITVWPWNGSAFGTKQEISTAPAGSAYDIMFSADGLALAATYPTVSPGIVAWPITAGTGAIGSSFTAPTGTWTYSRYMDRVGSANWILVTGGAASTYADLDAIELSTAGWGSTRRTTTPHTGDEINVGVHPRNPNLIYYGAESSGTSINVGIIPWTDAGGFGTKANTNTPTTGTIAIGAINVCPMYGLGFTVSDTTGTHQGNQLTYPQGGAAALKAYGSLPLGRSSINLTAGETFGLTHTSGSVPVVDWYALEYLIPSA